MKLPEYTGPFKVGVVDLEVSVRKPRNFIPGYLDPAIVNKLARGKKKVKHRRAHKILKKMHTEGGVPTIDAEEEEDDDDEGEDDDEDKDDEEDDSDADSDSLDPDARKQLERESRKEHKKGVKAANRERRKTKMPKAEKKKKMKKTGRKK